MVYVDSCKPNLWCADGDCAMPAWLTVRVAGEQTRAWCVDDTMAKVDKLSAQLEIRYSDPAIRILAIEGLTA